MRTMEGSMKVQFGVISNSFIVVDDHTDNTEVLLGMVRMDNNEVCQVVKSRYQSLNRLYLDETGMPHISTASVAGVLWGEDINRYNKEQENSLFPNRIREYIKADGTSVLYK